MGVAVVAYPHDQKGTLAPGAEKNVDAAMHFVAEATGDAFSFVGNQATIQDAFARGRTCSAGGTRRHRVPVLGCPGWVQRSQVRCLLAPNLGSGAAYRPLIEDPAAAMEVLAWLSRSLTPCLDSLVH